MALAEASQSWHLSAEEQDAILCFFRAAADSEQVAEEARRRLCESRDFEPKLAFNTLLAAGVRPAKGWIDPHDIHKWLTMQPHSAAAATLDDLTTIVAMHVSGQELWYEDFLRFVLPSSTEGAWLKDLAMSRQAVRRMGASDVTLPPDASYRLSQLFEAELDMCRRLRFHRQRLRSLFIRPEDVCRFADGGQGICAGLGGLLSMQSVKSTLVTGGALRLTGLDLRQCEALLRRINPTSVGLFPQDRLVRLLSPSFLVHDTLPSSPRSYQVPSTARLGLAASYRAPSPSPKLSVTSRLAETLGSRSPTSPTTPLPSFMTQHLEVGLKPPRTTFAESMMSPVARASAYTPGLASPMLGGPGRFSSYISESAREKEKEFLAGSPRRREPFSLSTTMASSADFYGSASPQETEFPGSPRSPGRVLESRAYGSRSLSPSRAVTWRDEWKEPMEVALPISSRATLGGDRPLFQVLQTMVRQAQIDCKLDDAKTMLPLTCTIEEMFDELDYSRTGLVSQIDVRRLSSEFGMSVTPYVSFCALVAELRLRRLPSQAATLVDRLQLRDFAVMALPAGGDVQGAVLEANSDQEARSVLYLLRNSDPCPGCGLRAQRTPQGCPSVSCPACGTHFRCFSIVGDRPEQPKAPMSVANKYQLSRLLQTWMKMAEDLETERRLLSSNLARELCGLVDVFGQLSNGKHSFDKTELRRTLFIHGFTLSEEELHLLWTRYAGISGTQVSFPDFRRQLQPRL